MTLAAGPTHTSYPAVIPPRVPIARPNGSGALSRPPITAPLPATTRPSGTPGPAATPRPSVTAPPSATAWRPDPAAGVSGPPVWDAEEELEFDDDLFKALLRRQAASVAVVTAPGHPATGGRPAGFTATSFTSVSLSPPLVSFGLSRGASSWATVTRADHVAVHLLAEHQQEVARTFATSGIDRFAHPTAWRPGPHGVPLLDEALAWLVCRVVEWVQAGDHVIGLAEPVLGHHLDDGVPLLYHMGRYAGLHR